MVALEPIERLSKILSLLAIPIVLAVGGWLIQKELADKSIKKDYVQLAISILSDNPDDNIEMRQWAVKIVNLSSPVPFTKGESEKLVSGDLSFLGRENIKLWNKHLNEVPTEILPVELKNQKKVRLSAYKNGDLLVEMGSRILWVPGNIEEEKPEPRSE